MKVEDEGQKEAGAGGWGEKLSVVGTGIETSDDSYVVVQLSDPEIMQYPFLYFSEPGSWAITPEEAKNFREYLQRGGFAMFDDFDGRRDWRNFYYCMKEVFAERELESGLRPNGMMIRPR